MTQVQRRYAMTAIALMSGAIAFVYRLLSLRGLPNDHYMHLAWSHQLLFGDVPGRDFVDPGMPLTAGLSAVVQWLWPGPFSEAVLCIAILAIVSAIVSLLTGRLTGSVAAACMAGLISTAVGVRLYSYPKVLVPAIALLVLHRYSVEPGRRWLIAGGVWVALAGLLRHDLAVYTFPALAVGLAAVHWPDPRLMMRVVAAFVLVACLALLPYTVFVQWSEGIVEHLRVGIEFSKTDASQVTFALPTFPVLDPGVFTAWGREDSAAVLFYLAHLVIPLSAVLLWFNPGVPAGARPTILAALVMLATYDLAILRSDPVARVPDAISLLAPVGAWASVEMLRLARQARPVVAAGLVVLMLGLVTATTGSAWQLGNVTDEFEDTRIADGWDKVRESFGEKLDEGRDWPWLLFWTSGPLPDAVRYLEACTQPTDRLLVTWFAPEYHVFARRPFAAGHAFLQPPYSYATDRDQDLMLKRLEQQRVPLVLFNNTERDAFVGAYPRLDAYLREHYVPAGTFGIYTGDEITIAVDKDLTARRSWGPEGWPCGFGPGRAASMKTLRNTGFSGG